MDDSRQIVAEFLLQVDDWICPVLKEEQSRFPTAERLLTRYQSARSAWGNRSVDHTREIIEIVNEMCIAKYFLKNDGGTCAFVEYERAIPNTNKTIDYFVKTIKNKCIYFDVKTVHPENKDSWRRYETAIKCGYFPKNTELILDHDFLGGEIAHDRFTSRERFLEHTLKFEEKIELIPDHEQLFFGMVFCGDGSQWREDHLEDFADFYRTGGHRPDDPFAEMEKHYLEENGIILSRKIHHFCYLERAPLRVVPSKWTLKVHGPAFPWS